MRLRQEQIVFLAAALVLALMGWSLLRSDPARRPSRGGDEAELRHFAAPEVAVALPNGTVPTHARELFAPPRDTRPLPPLELVEPPREPLAGLLPPTDPGPSPRYYGTLLRTSADETTVPELFGAPTEAGAELSDDEFLDLGRDEDAPRSLITDLRDAAGDAAERLESPAEREARFAGYRQRYDWIVIDPSQTIFGRIANEDRYGLAVDPERASEPILFSRVDPDTGREFYANIGAPPIGHARGEIQDFGFADTVTNEIEVRRLRLGERLARGSYEDALQLADYCVRQRLESPRALEIAEETYRRCAAFDQEDPLPRLGLARCYEAGFDFERAFAVYQELVETFPHRPEVHVRLALLEARFLLFEESEQRLRHAVSIDKGSWEARWGMGRFLADRGRHEAALEHLEQANRIAPQDPELLYVRVGIRTDLAATYLALGRAPEARRVFEQALAADPRAQRARAGLIATRIYGPAGDGTNDGAVASNDGSAGGFEESLARGIEAAVRSDWETSRNLLRSAADADPLRADRSLAALSYLAEVTGNTDEALQFAEEALEVAPENPWALYQRGRLLGARDDYEGARSSLLAALEVELDFEDALVALGEMAFRLGRFEDAERFLERALSIDAGRPAVHALRGINFLRLGSAQEARESFEGALAADAEHPTSLLGVAWCTYLLGDSEEARVLLANVDESRRALPEDDPYRVWARAQIDRIADHEQKVEWIDSFNRTRLMNGWLTRWEGEGLPDVVLLDGSLLIDGVFQQRGTVLVYREYEASLFVSFEADVWIGADTLVRAGVLVARERQRRESAERIAEASISRQKEGSLQVRLLTQGKPSEETDMQQPLPTEQWVRLRVERSGASNASTVTLSMDGIPLIEDVSMPGLGRASSPLVVGLFLEGDPGRRANVRMDNVSIVYRQ